MLTAKQEKYVNNLIAGMSQREAYRAAFDPKTASDETVDNKASKLLKKDKVRARYEELRGEVRQAASAAAVASAIEVEEFITAVMRGEIPDMSGRERLKSAELMAKRWGILTENMRISGATVQIVDDLSGSE